MNLYLPNMPLQNYSYPSYNNPYMNLQYQSMLFSQLNQLSQNFNPYCMQPPPPTYYQTENRGQKPITYIVID